MHIGIDFDNTIVSYDGLFHKVALEQGLIPADTTPSKLAVRDYLRRTGKEEIWTEMQGYVYGARMAEAVAYPGVLEFFRWARSAGIRTSIISHKTKHPFRGPKYDLHAAAGRWIETVLARDQDPLIDLNHVFFELTKDEKLARIGVENCDWFIDDLPEILMAQQFPGSARGILFDPDESHASLNLDRARTWGELTRRFSSSCIQR